MISVLRWIAVIVLTFYISLIYRSPSLMMLGYAQAALLLMAGLFLVYRMHTLTGGLSIPISIAERGRPLTLEFYVQNRSFLPCAKVKFCLEQRSQFTNKRRRIWYSGRTALPGENYYKNPRKFQNYGSYEFQLKKIRIYDLTGLFYWDKAVDSRGMVQIFPDMREIGVHITQAARNFSADADVYDDFRPGHDNSELFGLRPFQKGDKIQNVHWKISAKMDELLVKENSMPKACPVVFLLDYCVEKQKLAKQVNAYLVILASISFSIMDAGCAHYIAWYSDVYKDVVRVRVDDEESLYLFLSCYLEETFVKGAPKLWEAYGEKYRGEHCLHILLLNEALELWKDQEKIEDFKKTAWEEKLQALELIL